MHYSGMFYALIFINNHVFLCLVRMLLAPSYIMYFRRYGVYENSLTEPFHH